MNRRLRAARSPLDRKVEFVDGWHLAANDRACETVAAMGERATLRLDDGREVRVEVVREDADGDEIVVRRTADDQPEGSEGDLVAVVDAHLAGAARHADGTTDRLLAADRDRPY